MPFKLTESQSRKRKQTASFTSFTPASRVSPQNRHLTVTSHWKHIYGPPNSKSLYVFRKSLYVQLHRAGASRVYQAWCLPVKLLNLPGLWSFRRLRLGFKTSLLRREFHSSPDAIIPVSLAANSRQPRSGLHCKGYYYNQGVFF